MTRIARRPPFHAAILVASLTLAALAVTALPAQASDADAGDLVVIDGGVVQVSLYGNFQAQIAALTRDDNLLADGDAAEREGVRIRRARLGFSGWAWGIIDFALRVDATEDGVELLDAWIGYRNYPVAGFVLGAHKVPFSRFALLGSSRGTLSERAMGATAMAPFRQVGLTIEGDIGGLANYAIGAYNGFERHTNFHEGYVENPGLSGNRFNKLAFAGRLELAPLGSLGEDLADLDGGGLRVGVATAVYFNHGETTKTTGWEADLMVKLKGFHLAAEYLADTAEPRDEPTTSLTIPAKVDRLAVTGEVGYMLMAKKLGLALRVELLDDNKDIDDSGDELVVAGGLQYYWHRHHLKASLDYTHRHELHGTSRDNGTLLMMLQFAL